MIALLLWALTLAPAEAAVVAGRLGGEDPGRLRAIAWRESRLRRIGVHQRDVRGTRHAWPKAVQRGHLQPSWCPFHARGPDSRAWGTRGSWGHVAAFAAQYLPCAPPWVLDIPLVSAWVAVLRLRVVDSGRAPRALRAWAAVGADTHVRASGRHGHQWGIAGAP